MKRLALAALILLASLGAQAQDFLSGNGPKNPVRIDQRLRNQIPLDMHFKDETGADVRLGDYFGKRPVVLMPVYFRCPMLCNLVLDASTTAFSELRFDMGKEYEVISFSFDPRDDAKAAMEKKKLYGKRYGRDVKGWHFLTGDPASIHLLTDSIGFHYVWDPKQQQFAHGSALIVTTPQGKVARYFYGIEYKPRDLRLGLVEASQEKIGTVTDAIMLLCYHYDPATGKYAVAGMNAVRAGGVAMVLGIAAFVASAIRREKHSAPTGRER